MRKYEPLPHQKAFHDCNATLKAIAGEPGSGKTKALAEECVRLAKKYPGRAGYVIPGPLPVQMFAAMTEVAHSLRSIKVEPTMKAPVLNLDQSLSSPPSILLPNGSAILFLSDARQLIGEPAAWAAFDNLHAGESLDSFQELLSLVRMNLPDIPVVAAVAGNAHPAALSNVFAPSLLVDPESLH